MNLARATAAVGIAWASLAAAVAQPPAVETVAPPVATGDRAPLGTPAEELGYALGFRIGQRIIADHRALGTPLDPVALARGLADAVRDYTDLFGLPTASTTGTTPTLVFPKGLKVDRAATTAWERAYEHRGPGQL